MNQKLTEPEPNIVREKLQTLTDDLMKAGLKNDKGIPAKKKVLVYARKRIGIDDAFAITAAQWGKFFKQVDGPRFDLVGLARYFESLPAATAEPAQPVLPAFSAEDLQVLADAGISGRNDSRTPVRYWKEKA